MIKRLQSSDFVRHGTLVFGAIVAANAFTYLYYALIGRIVGVEGYGIVSALFSATLLVAVPPATVAATVVARIAADLHATSDGPKLRRLGSNVSIASLLVGAAAFGWVAFAAAPITLFFHLQNTQPVIAAGAFLAFSFSLPAQRGVFQGAQTFRAFSISNIIEAVTKCAFGVVLALRFGPTGALYGLALGTVTATAYNSVALLTLYGRKTARLKLDLRRILMTSSGIGVSVLAVNALLFYDIIIVRHFFPPVIVGLYGAATLAGRAVYTVVSFVPTIVLPKASARAVAGGGTFKLLTAALATAAAIIGLSLAVVLVAPRLVVTVLAGKHFAGASVYVAIYTAALGALALANIVAMYNIGLRKFGFVVPLSAVAVAEICFVAVWHASIFQVLTIVLSGHLAAFGATLYSVGVELRTRRFHFKDIPRKTL